MKFETETLYTVLNQKRNAMNFSWRELARKLHIDQSVFSRLANGKRPDAETFAKILYWLDQPVSMFLTVDDKRAPEEADLLSSLTAKIQQHQGLDLAKKNAIVQILEVTLRNLQ